MAWGWCYVGGLLMPVICLVLLPFVPALCLGMILGYIPETMWPTNLPHLLWRMGPRQRRRIGRSAFAEVARYRPIRMTGQQLEQYYHEGWVHLPGVLPPEVLSELRDFLLRTSGAALWPWSINGHMMYDELLDFYLFSSLGQLASQIFGDGPAYLWSDFRYWRDTGQSISSWHIDNGECESFLLPANQTARNRVRFWITLDDHVLGPVLFKQTVFNELLQGDDVARYWEGTLNPNASEFETDLYFKELAPQLFDHERIEQMARHLAAPEDVRLGDVIAHTPCLFHGSPIMQGPPRMVGFLCPTYQPEDSTYYTRPNNSPEHSARNCRHSLKPGERNAGHACFPQAYPAPEHLRGTQVDLTYFSELAGNGTLWHWYSGFVGRRFGDLWLWQGYKEFMTEGFSSRPLTWIGCFCCSMVGGFSTFALQSFAK